MTEASPQPKRVAILGGGMAALTAAYEITNTKDVEVTVHTLGWRLGGKCASSRGDHERIEEHGIHGFLGSYYNANGLLAAVYRELARPPSAPLATFDAAMVGMNSLQMYSNNGDPATRFNAVFPPNTLFPDPADPGGIVDCEKLIQFVLATLERIHDHFPGHVFADHLDALWPKVAAALSEGKDQNTPLGQSHPLLAVIEHALADMRGILPAIIAGLELLDPHLKEIISIIDWAYTLIKGALVDEVALKGFDYLDGENWDAWLLRHGARPQTVTAPISLNTVNLAYQYPHGDTGHLPAQMGAGAYAHWSLRSLAYCGHAVYAFAAGTGETVIAPMYEVLKARGVKFAFFSKVEDLVLSADATRVDSVTIRVQATPKAGLYGYEPLFTPPGPPLPSWPHEPHYDQLKEGDQMKGHGYDLESWWCPWQPDTFRHLKAGDDFDVLVFALSIGAVPYVCGQLIDANPAWQQMVKAIPTVRTQAFQIWLSETYTDLGWSLPLTGHDTALADTYQRPFDGHCEMRHVLKWESWPAGEAPKSLWYFCDELPSDPDQPPFSDHDYPKRMADQVKANAVAYLQSAIGGLMPKATEEARHGHGSTTALDFDLLVPPRPGMGAQAFDRQFWRANIDPTETYVQSPPGSTAARLRPWQSGFANLIIAGDWTYTGLNVGSVECAVMSGRLASWGITGSPALTAIPGYPANT